MANSESPTYDRPADLREMQYFGFEANEIVADGTVTLVVNSPKRALVVHQATLYIAVAEVDTLVTIQSESGQILFQANIDTTAVIPLSFGIWPWGFRCADGDDLQLVVSGGTTFEISVQGWGSR